MLSRRKALKIGLAAAGTGALARRGLAQMAIPQSGLVFPDGYVPGIVANPSPPATPFAAPLFQMPIAQPVSLSQLNPPPDPAAHQRYTEFLPKKYYLQTVSEVKWQYHPEGPYAAGSWGYAFDGTLPGPTFDAYYSEPILVRRVNALPPVGQGNVGFALPSFSIHLHNAHTASESDGFPGDFVDPGEFWDHHYANFPANNDPREVLNTLWYHDHRLDFTATNVYAGLTGFYRLFDTLDSGNEQDPNPAAFRLPSGAYDVPLVLHDVLFDQNGQPAWDFMGAHPAGAGGDFLPNAFYTNHGMLGDRFTVNRIIQPYFQVKRRKYRFRLLNGGPSRLYALFLLNGSGNAQNSGKTTPFLQVSNDGNLLPEPVSVESLALGVGDRMDIIIDFSAYQAGDHLYLINLLEMRSDGAAPSGRLLNQPDFLMRFDIVGGTVDDPSRIPDTLRPLPPIDLTKVRKERLFVFDYDNGLWTINGRLMDPNRIDAAIEQGSSEIWTFRNAGNSWVHPIHSHFEEFQILSINGQTPPPGRGDIANLGPTDEIRLYISWRDFLGKYVLHCHNVVHEDHAMMLRWDIVPPGQGD